MHYGPAANLYPKHRCRRGSALIPRWRKCCLK
jgi:hypothetical protein